MLSITVMNNMTQNKLQEERVYWAYTSTSQSIFKGSQGKNSVQELKYGL